MYLREKEEKIMDKKNNKSPKIGLGGLSFLMPVTHQEIYIFNVGLCIDKIGAQEEAIYVLLHQEHIC